MLLINKISSVATENFRFFLIFIPFVASSGHRAAGPGVYGLGPGQRGGVQCRAKPEAGYELSLYSLAGPTSMATCLLHGLQQPAAAKRAR